MDIVLRIKLPFDISELIQYIAFFDGIGFFQAFIRLIEKIDLNLESSDIDLKDMCSGLT